jgi:hypothetical protein
MRAGEALDQVGVASLDCVRMREAPISLASAPWGRRVPRGMSPDGTRSRRAS